MNATPITMDDVRAAAERLRPHLSTTPLRSYPLLDQSVGEGIRVWVKHENHQPTQSFKIRNGLNCVLGIPDAERRRGVIGASTGNHGQGIAYAGRLTGTPVTVCVPKGNNPQKNAAIRGLGAELVEVGETYDETVAECLRIRDARGLTLLHSTNNPLVIAGAGTITLEILSQQPDLDALIIALGGGSQSVGAITVAAALKPSLKVYAAGAAAAPAQYESWRQRKFLTNQPVATFAEGIATSSAYELTFEALRAGLAGFVTVTEDEIRAGMRDLLRFTANVAEGSGAVGLAGLRHLAKDLAGQKVGIVICGGNASEQSLREVFAA
jgi:threonine dehydratase